MFPFSNSYQLIRVISDSPISSLPNSPPPSPNPPETMADTQTEALLKLKILDGENLKVQKPFVRVKMKSFVLAWIDPRFKQSTKTLTTSPENPTWNSDLDFPLSLQTLQNPNSCVTIQVVSPVSAFRRQRVIGTAALPIPDVRFREEVFTLQLWRPSGRARGLVRVMARVEINLGFYRAKSTAPSIRMDNAAPSAPIEDQLTELEASQLDFDSVSSCSSVYLPQADQVPAKVEIDSNCESSCNLVELQPEDVDRKKNVELVCNCGSSHSSVQLPLCDLHGEKKVGLHCNCESVFPESRDDSPNVLRSLLVGFLGGAVAVATVLISGANG